MTRVGPSCSGSSGPTMPLLRQHRLHAVRAVSGSDTYSTTNTATLVTVQGTYNWKVFYSGDANNAAATSACGVESFTFDNDTTN